MANHDVTPCRDLCTAPEKNKYIYLDFSSSSSSSAGCANTNTAIIFNLIQNMLTQYKNLVLHKVQRHIIA